MTLASVPTAGGISLSQWYACVTVPPAAGRAGGDRPDPLAGAVRRGALAVCRAEAGCDLAPLPGGRDAGTALFDGYLVDRRPLVSELGLDHEAATGAQIVAAAYRRWGAGLFDRLDGCYLAAVWDAPAETLFLGHDALGRHPAFYAVDERRVWLAPNVLSLAGCGGVPTTPNRLSLALQFLLLWPDAGQTFFDGIRRVRPGHYLQASRDRIIEHQYWEPMPADDEPWLSEREVHDRFEPALMAAVERCLDLGAQGIMLSGGVDSVTVAALAAEHRRARRVPPLVAVSARTGGPLLNEEVMQSRVSEALAMPHVVSTTAEWKQGIDDVTLSLDIMPALPSPTRIWWVGTYTRFYRRTAGENLRVLLTGAGGDNWLGVADAHAADLLRAGRLIELVRFMRSDIATGGAALGNSMRRLLWSGGLRPHVDSWWALLAPAAKIRYHRRKWHERLPAWLAPDPGLRDALVEHLLQRRAPALTGAGTCPRSYYRHSLRSLTNPYMHHENEVAHHIESWCGLRLLSPYHDRRLVEFFNRIPPRTLVHGGRYKGLLRPLVARRLPHLGLENQRKDYPADLQTRKLDDLRQAIAAAAAREPLSTLATLGAIDPRAVAQECARSHAHGFETLARLFSVMSAERWIRAHASV